MKKNLLICFLLFSISCLAQFSKTHYLPPLSGSENISSSAQEQFLYISTPNSNPVNFKILQLGNSAISGTVSKSNPYVLDIGYGIDTQLMVKENGVSKVLSNKGFIVEAEDLIYVSVRVIAGSGNQSGEIVSKGLAALGTEFRVGSLLNTKATPFSDDFLTFVSILATENNTSVSFNDIKPGASLLNNASALNTPATINLNRGESFVMAVQGPLDANRDALIGSLVSSDKPIVVNCGSFTGSNATQNLDLGFDQIVSSERTGKEYIFIKSTGRDDAEVVLLVANENNTDIYLNGNVSPDYTLNAGEYVALKGNNYTSKGNLYVRTSKNVFAYQTVGYLNNDPDRLYANQELFFVPPLSCETPHVIDNIPFIERIGSRIYEGRVTLITQAGSSLTFEINGTTYTTVSLNALPGITVTGPTAVTGNVNYTTYTITGLKGDVGVFSSGQLYLAAYGTDDAATFGGFYSGFTFKPEISFSLLDETKSNCIPNTKLSVNTLSPFDIFQWYYNDNPIAGATRGSYTPTQPGYYYVKATIGDCGTVLLSDKIPVSSCPSDSDNDLVNDNIDIDFDGDGILNCAESLGNKNIDLSDTTGISTTTNGTASTTPFLGTTTGDFVTETGFENGSSVTVKKVFTQPTTISFEYVATANPSDLLNDSGEFILNSDINKTITIVNPNDQLLIDTNFDGIYESGVTLFSSFEIRFRLNSAVPLTAGSGTFKFKCFETTTITFTHKNLSETATNKATFKIIETCAPKDSDGDGTADYLDLDSDNDGIFDNIEAQGINFIAKSNTDANQDGLDDSYTGGLSFVDSDGDGIIDYLDLDSDNDGIYDFVESGCTALDANLDGIIDGIPSDFGQNGVLDSIETFRDSGILSYTVTDTDSDGKKNYLELDNDNDGCFDTFEAGFSDGNNDGLLGNNTPTTDSNGIVTNAVGYALPNSNYNTYATITIINQPTIVPTCELQNAQAIIETSPVNFYQWQVFSGGTWNDITDNSDYSGSKTNILQINAVKAAMKGTRYRVRLLTDGNSCEVLSNEAVFTIYDLPVLAPVTSLVQCDDDAISDGYTDINLRQKENEISSNYLNETFSYYNSRFGAQNADVNYKITNPLQFNNTNSTVWVRVENKNSCFQVAQLDVTVSSTQIPITFQNDFYKCDDFLDADGNNTANNSDTDGIATFDFSSVTAKIINLLPTTTTYSIKYYKNVTDASVETDESGNSLEISQNPFALNSIYNYRNIGYPNQQEIWVRIESDADNACYGLGPYIRLNVEKLPVLFPIDGTNIIKKCDDNQDGILGFDTSKIDATILNKQTNITLTYFDEDGTPLPSPLPNPFIVKNTKTITVRATNNSTLTDEGPCSREGKIQFIVDTLPLAFPLLANQLNNCDDELNPKNQNGIVAFDTSSFENTILGGQTGMTITYFDGKGVALSSPLPNPLVSASQNIKVKIENPINPSCFAERVLPLKVIPLPNVDLNENGSYSELVCTNILGYTVTLNAGVSGSSASAYTYKWYLDGVEIPNETKSTIVVSKAGQYSVDVSNSNNCFRTRTIPVTTSVIATIEDIKISDLIDNNTVEILVSGNGDYVYSLDPKNGFQSSNIFNDVPGGIQQVYVKDLNGCGTVGPLEIAVLGIPDFFTPNGDGYNDIWSIKGVNKNFNTNTRIEIYDRYGKLIKQINPMDKGWDGTYNGYQLPSDDYWYTVTFENNKVVKGHFSLKR
jgi:gliding motility-associated-like protein